MSVAQPRMGTFICIHPHVLLLSNVLDLSNTLMLLVTASQTLGVVKDPRYMYHCACTSTMFYQLMTCQNNYFAVNSSCCRLVCQVAYSYP